MGSGYGSGRNWPTTSRSLGFAAPFVGSDRKGLRQTVSLLFSAATLATISGFGRRTHHCPNLAPFNWSMVESISVGAGLSYTSSKENETMKTLSQQNGNEILESLESVQGTRPWLPVEFTSDGHMHSNIRSRHKSDLTAQASENGDGNVCLCVPQRKLWPESLLRAGPRIKRCGPTGST